MNSCFFILKPLGCIIQNLFHIIFFLSLNIKFLNTSKNLNSYSEMLWFYFITSKDFFEICSSKRKCSDNLHFLNILAEHLNILGSGTLKATWRDWYGWQGKILFFYLQPSRCYHLELFSYHFFYFIFWNFNLFEFE